MTVSLYISIYNHIYIYIQYTYTYMIWYIFVLVNYGQPTPTRDPASQQRRLAGSVLLLGFWDLLLARIVRCGRFTRKSGNSMDFPMKIGLIGEYNRIHNIFSQTHLVPAKDRWCSSLFRDIEQALPELVLWRVQVALTAPSSKESKGQTDRTCFQTEEPLVNINSLEKCTHWLRDACAVNWMH